MAFKRTDEILFKGIITGIYRIAQQNIFSGLNNLKEYNIMEDKYY